jgi:xanthine/uracil/vitamin C permease (AzgA family)
MSELAATLDRSVLGRRFRFPDDGTTLAHDIVARMTTFIVMSYIIFVNPAILGFAGVPGVQGQDLPFDVSWI